MGETNQTKGVVNALNMVSSQVWRVLQFLALLAVVVYGGHLLVTGHEAAGTAVVTGSFALLKFEVGADQNQNNS
jgi:hypothetical protein